MKFLYKKLSLEDKICKLQEIQNLYKKEVTNLCVMILSS